MMQTENRPVSLAKKIALVAHDSRKIDLLEWVRFNRGVLLAHELYATGTTGDLLAREADLEIIKLRSGPWGGDQQIGAKIADGELDFLIFFWDPLETQAHDTDVKALLRIAVVWNIPVACNRATADFIISSQLMSEGYERIVPDYQGYVGRRDLAYGAPVAVVGQTPSSRMRLVPSSEGAPRPSGPNGDVVASSESR